MTHIDQGQLEELQRTNPHDVALLKDRLAKLNARLGDDEEFPNSPLQPRSARRRD